MAETVEMDKRRMDELVFAYQEVERERKNVNEKAAELKTAKEELKEAEDTLTKLVGSLCRNLSGEELPLFTNQSEAIERANNDPVTQDLVKRLLAQGHDVNVLIVFGYTEEEKSAVRGYLDQMEAFARGDRSEYPDAPPVFLPAIVAAESLVTDLQKQLDVEVTAEAIQSLSAHEFATVVAYVGRVNALTAEKGDAVTFDDLPPMPPAVVRLRDGDVAPVLDDSAGGDEDIQDDAEVDDLADGVPVPADPEVEF